jgi:hypothetical protein
MKPGDVMTGSAKLDKAWKKLAVRWEATKLQWHDSVSSEFEERYVRSLESQIIATLQRMRSLSGVLTAAQHECDDRP